MTLPSIPVMALAKFPCLAVSALLSSIRSVFPNTTRKCKGKRKTTYVVGIEITSKTLTSDLISDAATSLCLSTSCSTLMPSASMEDTTESLDSVVAQLELERKQRTALEKELSTMKEKLEQKSQVEEYKKSLVSEMNVVLKATRVSYE